MIQFNGVTILGSPYTYMSAGSGGVIQYQNANIYGGSFTGAGTQILSGTTASNAQRRDQSTGASSRTARPPSPT